MDTSDTPRQEVPASTLPQIQVTVQGITNQYGAECLGQQMFHILREVGEYIDISALDGVTVAVDYDEALRDLDRGVEGLAPLSRTNDEGLAGVGKSIVVMRGDAVKTHIVLSAGPVCPIVLEEADRDEEDFRTAIAIIAHECAHVEENAFREDQFPGIHFVRRPDISSAITSSISPKPAGVNMRSAVCRRGSRSTRKPVSATIWPFG